jgi:hypothetical protein
MNVELNDETLSAYLDGELDAEQTRAVEQSLASDAGARLRVARMRAADERLAKALPLAGADHFHEAMVARIQNHANLQQPTLRRRVVPWAMAAGVAGLFAGFLAGEANSPALQLATNITRTLDTAASGRTSADGLTKVILSFRNGDSQYCRVFETTGSSGGEGLACQSDGRWQLRAWDGTSPATDGFHPAGASALIDTAVDALQGSAALNEAEELAALSHNWR